MIEVVANVVTRRGDVIELPLDSEGFGYVQDIGPKYMDFHLYRVFGRISPTPLRDASLAALVAAPSTYRAHLLLDSMLGQGAVRVAARLPVPAEEDELPLMQIDVALRQRLGADYGGVLLPDGTKIRVNDFLARYPGARWEGLVPFTPLQQMRERMLAGWTPDNDVTFAVRAERKDAPAEEANQSERWTEYLLFFPSFESAMQFATEVDGPELEVIVNRRSERRRWWVNVRSPGQYAEDFERMLERQAEKVGGTYDGSPLD